MKIYISEKTKDNLYLHSLYKRRYSKLSSQKFLEDFNSSIQLLNLFPYMYPKINSKSDYRKILFNKNFLIIYLINDNVILIDSIINCKQNYSNKFYFIV